jgi:hypothetical protein
VQRMQRTLTGSWSTGRGRKYPYYHCPRCSRAAEREIRVVTVRTESPVAGRATTPELGRRSLH